MDVNIDTKQSASYVKLILWCMLYAFIGVLIMIFVYRDRLRQFLDEKWHANRCRPEYMILAGFTSHVEGKTKMEKFEKNFEYCMMKNVDNGLVTLVKPFFSYIMMIKKLITFVAEKINTYRGAITVLRMMFKAIVSNTIEKLMNSYAAVIYIKEKMKNMVKRQAAIVEIIRQFLTGIPFILASIMYGPIPRFVTWLVKWIWLLIVQIAFCVLCMMNIPFVSWGACVPCALCFSPTSMVGSGIYRRRIMDVQLGSKLDENTSVCGLIYHGKANTDDIDPISMTSNMTVFYPLHDSKYNTHQPTTSLRPYEVFYSNRELHPVAWVTGEHAIYDEEKGDWCRVKEWAKRRNIRPVISNSPVVSLVTSSHRIPIHLGNDMFQCKDYEETGLDSVQHAIHFQHQCVLNHTDFTERDISDYVEKMQIRGIQLYSGVTYETFCKWVHSYDPGYMLPTIPSIDVVRNFFYNYQPSNRVTRYMKRLRDGLYGFRIERQDGIRWYKYRGATVAENTLVKYNGSWKRIYDIKEASRIVDVNASVTMEPSFLIHIFTNTGVVEWDDECITSDAMEIQDMKWLEQESALLDAVHNSS